MSANAANSVSNCDPSTAWEQLKIDSNAVLVDVRSLPEWNFVGVPNLAELSRDVLLVEWRTFPGMQMNQSFSAELVEKMPTESPTQIFFICRSGARSMDAARHMADYFTSKGQSVACINVDEGFEGDLNAERHRGGQNGWKACGLSWQQG